jgi:MFS family permease
MVPVVPLLAKDNGATGMQLGMIGAIPALTSILACIPGNSLGLRFGKRKLFIWSQYAGILCGIFFLLTKGLAAIAIPQITFGISNALFWATQTAYLTEVILPEKRASSLGIVMAMTAVGSIISPSVAGYVIDHAGYRPVFVLYIAMSAVGLMTASRLPRIPADFRGSVVSAIVTGYGGVGTLLKRPILQVTTASSFIHYVSIAAAESFISAFLRELHYSATFIGTNIAIRTAAQTGIRLLIGPAVKKVGPAPVLFGAVLSCAVAGALVPLFPNPGYIYLANVIIGCAYGTVPVMTSTLVAENSSSAERGMAMALDSTAASSGRTATGFGLGGIAQMIGYGQTAIVANALVAVGALFTMRRYLTAGRRPAQTRSA